MTSVSAMRDAASVWEEVFGAWTQGASTNLSLFDEDLFTTVRLHDPKYPTGRSRALIWWPAAEVTSRAAEEQRFLNEYPGLPGLESKRHEPRGASVTLNHLWRHRNNIQATSAVLCCASLFLPLFSRSKRDPWVRSRGSHDTLFSAYQAAASQWWQPGTGLPWHASSATALPDFDYEFKAADGIAPLAEDLASEHVALLKTWRPVVIEYVETALTSIVGKTAHDPVPQ